MSALAGWCPIASAGQVRLGSTLAIPRPWIPAIGDPSADSGKTVAQDAPGRARTRSVDSGHVGLSTKPTFTRMASGARNASAFCYLRLDLLPLAVTLSPPSVLNRVESSSQDGAPTRCGGLSAVPMPKRKRHQSPRLYRAAKKKLAQKKTVKMGRLLSCAPRQLASATGQSHQPSAPREGFLVGRNHFCPTCFPRKSRINCAIVSLWVSKAK